MAIVPTRRSLMFGSSLAALSGLAPAAVAAGAGGLPGREVFEALLGEQFRLADGRRLRLLRVQDSDAPSQPDLQQFSLLLTAGDAETGGLLELEHPGTGRFALCLEASGRDAEGRALLRADLSLIAA